ncbi:MAG: dihydrolipoamide acetyltransferase family protein [Gemmatimonadaceae bacterium]
MPTKVVMEALSPTMEEGRLVKWLKAEGDTVKSGDVLAEVETDKAIMELVARGDGVLRKRVLSENATAPVGALIGVIAAPDENIDELLAGSPQSAAPAAAPPGAESTGPIASGGARTSPPAPPGQPSEAPGTAGEARRSSPAFHQRHSEAPGAAGEASTSPPASPRPSGAPSAQPEAPSPAHAPQPLAPAAGAAPAPSPSPLPSGPAKSSPLARRLAAERGLDLRSLQGSGPGGRIVKRDIEAAVAAPARPDGAAAPATPRLTIPSGADYADVPLTQMRKTIARRLVESIGPIPTFYLTAEFDLERVAEMRSAMAELGDEYKVSFNDIVLKATATALAQHPECNAHWLGDAIRYWNRVHLGMAVAVEEGLITPVIFDANLKSLSEIAHAGRDLAGRARQRRLKPDEYTGATFSVSNLGMLGIEQFTAIINPPEAGILAIGAIEPKPVLHNGAVAARRRMRVTMSCDHRVIDGATGARFLQTLRRLIENPLLLVY